VTSRTLFDGDEVDRGISEVLGTALLIGLVIFASFIVVVMGASPIGQAEEQNRQQSAQTLLQEVDSRLATLSSSSNAPSVELRFVDSLPRDFDTERFGYLNLTVNRNATCSFQQSLNRIRYDASDNREVAYEAGGVFRATQDSSTTLTSPDVNYRDGALDITLVNISGNVDQGVNQAELNVSASEERTRTVSQGVLQGVCKRPDHVTLRVKSRFYDAWARYLESETEGRLGATVTAVDSNMTAVLQLDKEALPRSVDDYRNTVVNLSEAPKAPYMEDVQIPYRPPPLSAPANEPLWIDKNASNNYTVFVEPLTEGGLDVSELKQMNGSVGARRPVDVVLVMDQSGSMGYNDSDDTNRSYEAKQAAQQFIGQLNRSTDRVAVVSYSDDDPANYHLVDGEAYISGDFTAVNQSIPNTPNGGTRADTGLELANTIVDLYSNESRRKIVILLTDGNNDRCNDNTDDDVFDCWEDYGPDHHNNRAAMELVNDSDAGGGDVYTIGFGDDDDIDEAFLQMAARVSGGTYHQATNASALNDAFNDIQNEISNQTFVARTPLTTNLTASSQVYTPQIAGDTDGLGNVNISGRSYLNVNDPQAPSRFSHSFAIQDGEELTFNVTQYGCDEWESTPRKHSNNSSSYQVVRCADLNKSEKTTIYPRLDNDDDAPAGTNAPSFYGEGAPDDPIDGVMIDGDDASALIANDPAWWQTDINESLSAFPDVSINKTTGELSMSSNQALVIFDLPDGKESSNMMILLYQVGLSESAARPEGVINIQISEVSFGD